MAIKKLIGTDKNQVPLNRDLGTLAYQDSNAVNITGGIVDVSAGTAALPSLGAAGDENTGLFFPAADTVAVTTGGAERVRVTSAGDVGVGLNNPATYGSRTNFYVAGSLGGALLVGNPSKTLQGVMLGDSNNGVMDFGTTTNHPVKFLTNNAERMRITSAGTVGVGTVSPSATAQLTVAKNDGIIEIQRATGTAFPFSFGIASDGRFNLYDLTNSTERLSLTQAGNLGVGATPTARLDVNGDTVRVRTARTPASATAAGNAGDICWDANYVYVCVATNTWKRSALSTW